MRRSVAALLAVVFAASAPERLMAQGQKLLTIDDLYDPEKRVDFNGNPPTDLAWVDDAHYVWPRTDPKAETTEWLRIEAATGKAEPLFDVAKAEAVLSKVPGVTAAEALRLVRSRSLTMNDKRTAALFTIGGDLYYYSFGGDRVTRLTATRAQEEEATFSPDGSLVAFVRKGNLFVVDVATQRERPITTDGGADVLNGKLDWVYQEEVYGRGHYRGYWWSPDSSHLAFLRLDERAVPKFTLEDHIPYRLEIETWAYPKAGDANPTARLGIAPVNGAAACFVDLDRYATGEFLIVDVAWTPDSAHVVFEVQDREQTWLDLDTTSPSAGETRTLFREKSPAWVDRPGSPKWLRDGSFLWSSERSGFRHLYHYTADGALLRQVTDGKWEARALHGVDELHGYVYFSGTQRSPIGSDVVRVRLDATGLTRLSETEGTHNALFNPSFTHYIDSWSDETTPMQVRLHRADGSLVRVIDENRVPALAEYRFSKPEFLEVKTRDGSIMEAMLIKPPDFDPSRKYPVFQHTYGGPHAPSVRNAWDGKGYPFLQMVAQKGIAVWVCDNRTASGKGAESVWPVYERFGELELRDIEDGLTWLKGHAWVDGSRIGLFGWSFGGFMTTYALTHSRSFAMGIAGGSVTDWRDYDTIYTERYMRMPQNDPEGYKKTSPRFAAKDLHGELLLIHGTMDDNVHTQNTLQLAYELQKAGKPFRMMLYPKSRHQITDPLLVKHMRTMMLDFIIEHLLGSERR